MTNFTVNLYREMRLSYAGIEAESPEAAAAIARGRPTSDADDIEDCEGETLAALVDTAGDDDYRQSVTVDFEQERIRKAAPALLAALEGIIGYAESEAECLESLKDRPETEAEAVLAWNAIEVARAAISQAVTAGIAPADIDIHGLLAARRRIAAVWSIEDVREIRPDLDHDRAWEVLRQADRQHDASGGINWDVLACHAETLYGYAPNSGEAGEE